MSFLSHSPLSLKSPGEQEKKRKKANITLVFKKGKKEDPGNYRPISLPSNSGKVMEQLLLDVASKQVEEKKVIRSSQHGFMLDQSDSFL